MEPIKIIVAGAFGKMGQEVCSLIDREDQFDSGLWELDGPMHRVNGILFQTGL